MGLFIIHFCISIGILLTCKLVWKKGILAAYKKVPYKSKKEDYLNRYSTELTLEQKYAPIQFEKKEEPIIVSVENKSKSDVLPKVIASNSNKGMIHQLTAITNSIEADVVQPIEQPKAVEQPEMATVKVNETHTEKRTIIPSFPRNERGMKMIPKLDFTWKPTLKSEEINKITENEWKNISKEEETKTLFATVPPSEIESTPSEELGYNLPVDPSDIPNVISGEFFEENEVSWHNENKKVEIISLENLFTEMGSQQLQLERSEKTGPTHSMKRTIADKIEGRQEWTVRVIGEEDHFIHVEDSTSKIWAEIKYPTKHTFTIGKWYKIDVVNAKGSHFPLIESSESLESVSEDFLSGDQLNQHKWNEQGLAAYR